MNWFLVNKAVAQQPAEGTYKQWKPLIRGEGQYQCVYCAIGEGLFGGERNFHVEHYKPKKSFAQLVNTFSNLFYSCSICNAFKSSDWPAEPDSDLLIEAYPDPSVVDYASFLFMDDQGSVASNTTAGKYIVVRLNLNRPQLVMVRQLVRVLKEITDLTNAVESAGSKCFDPIAMQSGIACLGEAVKLLAQLPQVVPYETADARR